MFTVIPQFWDTPAICSYVNGMVFLIGSRNSRFTASSSIVDADGNPISSLDSLNEGDELQATVTVELPVGVTGEELARLQDAGEEPRVMNIFLTIYDSGRAMGVGWSAGIWRERVTGQPEEYPSCL